MKPRRLHPNWVLAFSFLIAPVICAFNAGIAASLPGFNSGLLARVVISGSSSFPALTWPLGVMTWVLLHVWNDGHFHRARLISLGWGIVSAAFWVWVETVFPMRFDLPEVIGGLLLPFLWSLGFFVFALCARPSKN